MEFYVYKVGDMYLEKHDIFYEKAVLSDSIEDAYIAKEPASKDVELARFVNRIGAKEIKLKEV